MGQLTFERLETSEDFADITFREWPDNYDFAGMNFYERPKKSRNCESLYPGQVPQIKYSETFPKRISLEPIYLSALDRCLL